MKKTFCDICHKEMDESESNFNITFTDYSNLRIDNMGQEKGTEKKVFNDVCQKCYSKVYTYIDKLKRDLLTDPA